MLAENYQTRRKMRPKVNIPMQNLEHYVMDPRTNSIIRTHGSFKIWFDYQALRNCYSLPMSDASSFTKDLMQWDWKRSCACYDNNCGCTEAEEGYFENVQLLHRVATRISEIVPLSTNERRRSPRRNRIRRIKIPSSLSQNMSPEQKQMFANLIKIANTYVVRQAKRDSNRQNVEITSKNIQDFVTGLISQHQWKKTGSDVSSIKAMERMFQARLDQYLQQQEGQAGQKQNVTDGRSRSQNRSPRRKHHSPSPMSDSDEKRDSHNRNKSFLHDEPNSNQNTLDDAWHKIMQHSRTCVIDDKDRKAFPDIADDVLSDHLTETYITSGAEEFVNEDDAQTSEKVAPGNRTKPRKGSDDDYDASVEDGESSTAQKNPSKKQPSRTRKGRDRNVSSKAGRKPTTGRHRRRRSKEPQPKQRKISGYLLSGHILGRGVSSQVELGLDPRDNKLMALKVIRKYAKVDPRTKQAEQNLDKNQRRAQKAARKKQNMLQLAMAEREILALSRLRHNNIIRISAYDVDANYPPIDTKESHIEAILISLEFLQGGDLFDYISNMGALESRCSRTYWHQLADGLENCHQHGVAHRDIKLENIMFDKNFMLKLCDFGISATFDPKHPEMMNEHVGTKVGGYMAPELVDHLPYDGCAADIWSAGAVLFVMLAGVPPMEEASKTDWYFVQIRNKQWGRFWKQHNNDVFDTPGCKELFHGIFETDFKKRLTIPQIRQGTWHKSKIWEPEKLRHAMMKRYRVIQEQSKSASIETMRDKLVMMNKTGPSYNES